MNLVQQKEILRKLDGYLTGGDGPKQVMNSPCVDRFGKTLSRDGTQAVAANRDGTIRSKNNGNNHNGKRRRGGNNNQQKGEFWPF